jgi:Polyketide synthase modules and related proteins
VQLSPPTIPFVSTVTASWITAEQATDPMYWARHLRATVRFADGIKELWQAPNRILLEVGPRTTVATLARKQAKDLKKQVAISSLSDNTENQAEWTALLSAVGQLWLCGVSIDWQSFYQEETRDRIPLPTYPFESKRFWIEPKVSESTSVRGAELPNTQLPIPNYQSPITNPKLPMPNSQVETKPARKYRLIPVIKNILEETSGEDLASVDEDLTFLEMGLDSLSLTQVALNLQKQFSIKVTFRQLLETVPTLGTLSEFIDRTLPPEVWGANPVVPQVAIAPEPAAQAIAPTAKTQQHPVPTINHGKETALPSPLDHSGATGIDLNPPLQPAIALPVQSGNLDT